MKKLVVGLALSCAALCSSAVNADFFGDICPQVGLDAKYAYVQPKSEFRNLVKKHYWGGNIYALFRFCEVWGLELGYEHLFKSSKRHTVAAGEDLAIAGIPVGTELRGRVSFNTWHADLNWYYCICDCWDTILSVGVAHTKPKVSVRSDIVEGSFSRFSGKVIPRARIGLQYMMWQCFGIRGLLGWDNTSRIKARSSDAFPAAFDRKPFKDTWSASLGIFYTFA